MNEIRHQVLKLFPIFTVLFSFWAVYATLGILIETKQNFIIFSICLLQVYLNWIAVLVGNRNCTAYNTHRANFLDYKLENIPLKTETRRSSIINWNFGRDKVMDKKNFFEYDFLSSAEIEIQKVWYCPRCCKNSFENCHHCSVCRRCIVEQDHHCFFLGTCISNNNIQYFVVFLIYLFFISSYVTVIICKKMNLFNFSVTVLWHHFFPVSFARWLSDMEYSFNLMEIFLLNVMAVLALFSIVFASYYLCRLAALNSVSTSKSQHGEIFLDLLDLVTCLSVRFCKCGFINLVFPTILLRYCFPLSSYTYSIKGK